MLIDFTVRNFRAFRDPQTLTLVAGARDRQHEPTHVFAAPDETRLLHTALVYGPNASGKTTLIRALDALRWLVLRARKFDEDSVLEPIQPFRLDIASRIEASEFEVTFVAEGIVYEYALSATRERVVNESLRFFPEGRASTLFTRKGDAIVLGKRLRGATAKAAQSIAERRSNTPFLSLLGQNEEPRAIEAYRWFKDVLRVASGPLSGAYALRLLRDDPDARTFILDLLRLADVGIRDITVESETVAVSDQLRQLLGELGTFDAPPEVEQISARFRHGTDTSVEFEEDDESLGTLRLLALAGPLYDVFANGRVLVVDELASSLHPDLVAALVRLFHTPDFNRHHAQLVASTHDATQLDLGRLRRDNVWFTEKARDGAAKLLALADVEGVRADTALMKNYLQGRFGGLPAHGLSLLTFPEKADGPPT